MRKSFSALGTSSRKYLSAVRGRHSFSETVLHFSLALFGLICSFHSVQSFPIIFGIFAAFRKNKPSFLYFIFSESCFANIALLLYRICKPLSRGLRSNFLQFPKKSFILPKNRVHFPTLTGCRRIIRYLPPLLSSPLSARSFCRRNLL